MALRPAAHARDRSRRYSVSVLLLLLACEPLAAVPLAVYAPDSLLAVLESHVVSLPHDVRVAPGEPDPAETAALTVTLKLDDTLAPGSFVVQQGDVGLSVQAGDTAGALHGLAQTMEWHGWRFSHPFYTVVPESPTLSAGAELGSVFSPEMARRGLHLHTLHPTEAMFDLWAAPDRSRADAMLDWVVRNRGNHVQWPGLDDIAENPETRQTWADATALVVADAHARGMTAGLGVQLFGASNLQLAYDLLDDSGSDDEDRAAMEARWRIATEGIGWDDISLSFGEFFSAEPDAFIDRVEMAYDTLQTVAPGTEMAATIHVGGNDDVQVEYDGKSMTYYFLVDYADRPIEPSVHTVMFYNLYEDAGGAYGLDDFSEHREYLESKLSMGDVVNYHPESAYWVAFDNSVPTYLPLYVRSRWLDLATLRDKGLVLDRHVLFESGWEWGYWQNDAATLRMNYRLPDNWQDALSELFADPDVGASAVAVAEAEHDALIGLRLAPYLAGRDIAMDIGETQGIFAQPDRIGFDELAELDAEARGDFANTILVDLSALADAVEAANANLDRDDPIAREVSDGIAITAARARYVVALYTAALLHSDQGNVHDALSQAEAQLEIAVTLVADRRAHFHDPEVDRLVIRAKNPTLYDYGYLFNADTLCFWQRERAEVRELVLDTEESDPGCTL